MFSSRENSPVEDGEYHAESKDFSEFGAENKALSPAPSVENEEQSHSLKDEYLEKAQLAVNEINVRRQKDVEFLEEMKNSLHTQVEKYMETLDQELQNIYTRSSEAMDKQLEKLSATLERVQKMQAEIQDLKTSLNE